MVLLVPQHADAVFRIGLGEPRFRFAVVDMKVAREPLDVAGRDLDFRVAAAIARAFQTRIRCARSHRDRKGLSWLHGGRGKVKFYSSHTPSAGTRVAACRASDPTRRTSMKGPSGENLSVWLATAEWLEAAPLLEDEDADVCVIGAGIAGITTAYLLALEGKSVVVIDDGPSARRRDRPYNRASHECARRPILPDTEASRTDRRTDSCREPYGRDRAHRIHCFAGRHRLRLRARRRLLVCAGRTDASSSSGSSRQRIALDWRCRDCRPGAARSSGIQGPRSFPRQAQFHPLNT